MNDAGDKRREQKVELIRREIEILLHSPLRNEEWDDLVEENYIDEVLDDLLPSSEVAEKVRRRRQVYGQQEAKRDKAPRMLSEQEAKKPSGRLEALSILVAQEATKDTEVQKFRNEVLNGKLLSLDAVEEWIQEQAKKDGPHTWWLEDIALPENLGHYRVEDAMAVLLANPQARLDVPMRLSIRPAKNHSQFRFLEYGVPGNNEKKEIPTAIDGVLEQLNLLSERLAEEFGWTKAEATLFILTASVPEIAPVTSTLIERQLSALSRIVLTVDPSLSPREVAEYYRKMRQEVMGARHRDLSEKHLQLAIFAATQPEERTWSEKMAVWNKSHPTEWRYEEVGNFSHDCLQARRRLLRSE